METSEGADGKSRRVKAGEVSEAGGAGDRQEGSDYDSRG